MRQGLIKGSFEEKKLGVITREMIHSLSLSSQRVKGPLFKLSSTQYSHLRQRLQ